MSFILDALKKSELERQRQSVAGLMDVPSRARRSRWPKWALGLGLLLVVNLAVLSVILVKRDPPSAHVSPPTHPASRESDAAREAPAAAVNAAPSDRPFSPMDEPPVYAPEIPLGSNESALPHPAPAPSSATARSSGEPAGSPRRSDPLLTQSDPPETQEFLPSINEINLTGSQRLPELHLDVHVYATRPAERFVYINMRKYHEGSVLQEGPLIERIRRDGVVLNHQGLRFLLPRAP